MCWSRKLVEEGNEIILATRGGQAAHFDVTEARSVGRQAIGDRYEAR